MVRVYIYLKDNATNASYLPIEEAAIFLATARTNKFVTDDLIEQAAADLKSADNGTVFDLHSCFENEVSNLIQVVDIDVESLVES